MKSEVLSKSQGLKYNTLQIQLCPRSPSPGCCCCCFLSCEWQEIKKKNKPTQNFSACQHPAVIRLLLAPKCSTSLWDLVSLPSEPPGHPAHRSEQLVVDFQGVHTQMLALHFPLWLLPAPGGPHGTLSSSSNSPVKLQGHLPLHPITTRPVGQLLCAKFSVLCFELGCCTLARVPTCQNGRRIK